MRRQRPVDWMYQVHIVAENVVAHTNSVARNSGIGFRRLGSTCRDVAPDLVFTGTAVKCAEVEG